MGKLTTQVVPLESVIFRVLELLPQDAVSEERLEEWAYQAYEEIAAHDLYEQNVCFATVNNHRASIPKGAFRIDMVLYKAPTMVSEPYLEAPIYTSKEPDHLVTQEILDTFVKKEHQMSWRPLQYSSNAFHNTVLCNMSPNLHVSCKDTFTINPRANCIVTSFEIGHLAIAYAGIPQDPDTGKWYIPDKEEVKRAIESYMFKRYWQWQMNMKEEGAANMYQLYSNEWELLAAKAKGELMMPDFIEYQTLRNVNKFIKEDSPFSTALGALNNSEYMNFGRPHGGMYHARFNPPFLGQRP